MRDNSKDRTIERNYIQKWRFLVREYELVKASAIPSSALSRIFMHSTTPAGRPSPSTTTDTGSQVQIMVCCP